MAPAGLSVGTRCYIPDAAHVWLPVSVEHVDERARSALVRPLQLPGEPEQPQEQRSVPLGDAHSAEFPLQNLAAFAAPTGVDNMISLDHLHEAAILHNLRKRFAEGLPYTYTGDICVAINPYRWLDELYARDLHAKYLRAKKTSELPPHVYAVAVAAFRHLRDDKQNQSILVSGESGAGKTETTKIVMDNLATIAAVPSAGGRSAKVDDVADQQATISRIVEVNPLLESFGNATTKRNDNSSRFGKFTQLQFDSANVLCGAQCETYLLEKTRVVTQDAGERNYHIFYQLLHGATDEEKQAFGLDGSPKFSYLRRDADIHTEKVVSKDARNYGRTKQALGLLGLDAQQQETLFQAVAGILHLGEASFVPLAGNEDASTLDKNSVALSSVLLGIDVESMNKALCNRTMRVGAGEVYAVPLTPAQAADGRDALAKAVYSRIFDWMVARINDCLRADEKRRGKGGSIGVLDIFGFESFVHNSFEQLCINYANEKLQQKFTLDVFRTVQDEYASEGISWDHISYPDNSAVLALIEGKLGVIALLNEETVRPKGNAEGFVSKLANAYRKDKHLIEFPRLSRTQFAIHHYAEKVTYEANGFLEKHKDSLLSDLSDLMLASREGFIKALFIEKPSEEPKPAKGRPASRKFGGAGGGGDSGKNVGTQFKVSLTKLMETITATNVHYIRCIKPNSIKSPQAFDATMVVNQLRCAGVIEAVTIARAGYPNRMAHNAFAEQFDIFLSEAQQTSGDHLGNCQVLAKQFKLVSPAEFQMGKTKIYLQKGVLEKLERARAERLFAYVARIQSRWRGVLGRQEAALRRVAVLVLQRRGKVFAAQCVFQRQQRSIRTIQRVYRGHQGRKICMVLRRERAASRIQRVYRGMKGRRMFFAVLCQSRAVRIQCAYRQRLARKALVARRAEFEAEQAKLAAEERERQRIAREEQRRREEEERERQRIAREEQRRLEEEERERQRIAEEERLRREEEERQQRLLEEKSAVHIQRCVRGFSGRRLFRELVLEKEKEDARRAEEEERERQRQQQELEAARRAAEEAERERQRQAEERKRQAILRREQREKAAVTVQRHIRGRLQRQKFAELKVERDNEQEQNNEEMERIRQENEALKQQLEQLLETNHELEALVAEWKCERDVLLASNNLREIELTQQLSAQKKELDAVRHEYSTLCDYMEKNSAGSTEPDDLHSGPSDHEDVGEWVDDEDVSSSSSSSGSPRSSIERDSFGETATTSSFFDEDRPSVDVADVMRQSRPTNLSARTSRLGASLVQRRQQASRSYQRGKQEASKKLSASASAITRAKKWATTKKGDRASSKHTYQPRSMEF